jgi:hypothetical protein
MSAWQTIERLVWTDRWRVARLVAASDFSLHGRTKEVTASHVWADAESGAYLCQQGEELAVAELPPPPQKGESNAGFIAGPDMPQEDKDRLSRLMTPDSEKVK